MDDKIYEIILRVLVEVFYGDSIKLDQSNVDLYARDLRVSVTDDIFQSNFYRLPTVSDVVKNIKAECLKTSVVVSEEDIKSKWIESFDNLKSAQDEFILAIAKAFGIPEKYWKK